MTIKRMISKTSLEDTIGQTNRKNRIPPKANTKIKKWLPEKKIANLSHKKERELIEEMESWTPSFSRGRFRVGIRCKKRRRGKPWSDTRVRRKKLR